MALKGDKATTSFGPPVVAPGVPIDPAAAKYVTGRGAAPPAPAGFAMPVAGGPPPSIPPLTQKPTGEGMAMADYAAQRMRPQFSPEQLGALGQPQESFVQPPRPPGMAQFRPSTPASPPQTPFRSPPVPVPGAPAAGDNTLQRMAQQFSQFTNGLQDNDLLPARAREDPNYQSGLGSDIAKFQPTLAFKYGVIRNGTHLMPQQLTTGRPGMSPAAVEGVATLMGLQEQATREEPSPRPEPPATVKKDEAKENALDTLDEYDWMKLRDVANDMLSNEKQRRIVEARCKPLRFEEMLMTGSVTQDVPIVVDPVTRQVVFQPTFRSVSAQQDLAMKRLLLQEAKALDIRGAYFDDKFAIMGACASTIAINGHPLPPDLDENGNFIEALFWEKFNYFVRFPLHMVASLGVHVFWFDNRVRRLFVAEEIKNG